MGTGPKATAGYDLALTELLEDGGHRFVVEVGSERGAEVLAELPHREAAAGDELAAAERAIENAPRRRWAATIDTDGIKDLLYRNREHPRWDEVADRCLTCGNCTMVCPTCFCTTVEDVTDLAGEDAERARRWDSCFTLDYSYIHGGSVRASTQVALPPVDDPQARDLDRPVRHARAASAAAAASPGARSAIDITEEAARDPRRPTWRRGGEARCRRSTSCSPRSPFFAGLRRRAPRADRGLRAATCASTRASYLFREGEPADTFYRDPPRHGRARDRTCPQRGAVMIETLHDGDVARLVLAVPALPLASSTRARSATCAPSRSTAPACAASARRTTQLGYELMQRFAAVMVERLQATRLQLLDVYGQRRRR